MLEFRVYDRKWYLAFQDGPADNVEYDTEAEAIAAWSNLGEDKRSVCVMSRVYDVSPGRS